MRLRGLGHREVEEPGRPWELEGGQAGLLAGGGRGPLRDLSVGGRAGDQVHPVEFVAGVAPGVVGGVRDHSQEQQCEPAQLDGRADPVLAVMEHGGPGVQTHTADLPPGHTATLTVTTRPGSQLTLTCEIPGHEEAGMRTTVAVIG